MFAELVAGFNLEKKVFWGGGEYCKNCVVQSVAQNLGVWPSAQF